MYPISLGYDEARKRISCLLDNEHRGEAMLAAVFTAEKTIRRALLVAAVSRGLTNGQARTIIGQANIDRVKKLWTIFYPGGVGLPKAFGPGWPDLATAIEMRNKIVHGARVYPLAEYERLARSILASLETFRATLTANLGHDGWARLPVRRKSSLHWDPPASLRRKGYLSPASGAEGAI